MADSLVPPGETTRVLARSVLIVAPHFDDEIIGCGGLLAQLAASGADATVLYVSDSAGGREVPSGGAEYSRQRQEEAARGLAVLGLESFELLGLPDGSLDRHLDAIVAGVRDALRRIEPELLLAPSPLEITLDHQAVFTAVHRCLAEVREDDPLAATTRGLRVLLYEVNRLGHPDILVDVSAELDLVDRAMAEHRSQLELHDYRAATLAMRRYRTFSLPPGVDGAEGYVDLRAADFVTTSAAQMIERLGGRPEVLLVEDGPLVSVVVRTRDRPELLREALGSIAASGYRRVEVVLVNDGGRPPAPPEGFPFAIRRVEHASSRGRAAAANAGIAAATGDLVCFLDDDDLMAPEHLATLTGLARGADVRVAYTDAAVAVYEPDAEDGWREVERRLPYSRDFDADLLLLDNYIPFNTLIIERGLLSEAGPLDPELPFFEDWDLLIRLSRLAPFHHLRRVTCEYRHFRGGAHHVFGERPAERSDFLTVKARVLERHRDLLDPATLARVVARLRGEVVEQAEVARGRSLTVADLRHNLAELEDFLQQARAERSALSAERDRLRADQQQLVTAKVRLEEEVRRLYDEEKRLSAAAEQRGAELERTTAEVARLSELVRTMEETRAWRLHRALERLRGRDDG